MKTNHRTADRLEPNRDPELLELGLPEGFLLPVLGRRNARRESDPRGHFGPATVLDPLFEELALFAAPELACA